MAGAQSISVVNISYSWKRNACTKFDFVFIYARIESLTNQLTTQSKILAKFIVNQQVKKFPTFYGTRQFITLFTVQFVACF
jgi:hypothetical protein